MKHKPTSCSWCSSKDFKRGTYLTLKGYAMTRKHQFRGMCPDHSKKLHFIVIMAETNLDKVYEVLQQLKVELEAQP